MDLAKFLLGRGLRSTVLIAYKLHGGLKGGIGCKCGNCRFVR